MHRFVLRPKRSAVASVPPGRAKAANINGLGKGHLASVVLLYIATQLHAYRATHLPSYTLGIQPNRESAPERRSQVKRLVIIQDPKQPKRAFYQLGPPV